MHAAMPPRAPQALGTVFAPHAAYVAVSAGHADYAAAAVASEQEKKVA